MINKDYQNKKTLQLLYDKHTLREIAEMFGVSFQLVHWYVQKFKIKKIRKKRKDEKIPVKLKLTSKECIETIKGIKKGKNLTNYDIGSLIGLSANAIYQLERGLVTAQHETGKKLLKLCRRLNKDS